MNIYPDQSFPRHRRGKAVQWLLLFFVAWVCAEARAVMLPLATTTLVDRASCIVEGRVSAVTSHWTEDRSGIVTEVTLDVKETLLGDTNRVTFLYPGGVVGQVGQRVSDMPSVTNGQEVLVFLRQPKPSVARHGRLGAEVASRPVLVGAAQGLMRLKGGRAVKDGFSVAGEAGMIDRDVDVKELKSRIRQRLSATHRAGGVQ